MSSPSSTPTSLPTVSPSKAPTAKATTENGVTTVTVGYVIKENVKWTSEALEAVKQAVGGNVVVYSEVIGFLSFTTKNGTKSAKEVKEALEKIFTTADTITVTLSTATTRRLQTGKTQKFSYTLSTRLDTQSDIDSAKAIQDTITSDGQSINVQLSNELDVVAGSFTGEQFQARVETVGLSTDKENPCNDKTSSIEKALGGASQLMIEQDALPDYCNKDDDDDDSSNVGAIVGGIIGGLVGAGVIGFIVYRVISKKNAAQDFSTKTSQHV